MFCHEPERRAKYARATIVAIAIVVVLLWVYLVLLRP